MDHDRFDDLTRSLGTGISRRQALKLLGGSLAGGLLSALGLSATRAQTDDRPTTSGMTVAR